ncbi:MAG: ABC transporter substrate-binding protein [Rhodoglobus sp.]
MKRTLAIASLFMASGLALAGCAAPAAAPEDAATALAPDAAALLPAEITEAGVITVAADAHYAPMDFYEDDGSTLTGADYEMGQALGEALGVKMEVTDVSFDNIIPSLKSGQYDMAVTFMTDTVERQAEVDFVDSYQSGSSILVATGNPEGIESITDLCGLTVVTTATSVQNELAAEQDEACADLGKDPIEVMNVTTDTEALLQVKSGRAVADLSESVAAAYNASTSNDGKDFEVINEVYGAKPVGMVVAKGNDDLTAAVEAGMKFLKESGTYDKILAKWGLESLAIDEITVNGATE